MNTNLEALDTHVRTWPEVIARMIRPIPTRLINQKTDASKADYINITTLKDLLDVACGRGNWRATVEQIIAAGNHLGMVVRLSICALNDEGITIWLHQDGTGHEVTDNAKIYGDPLSNSYAQALRRAAESFGLARELWRGETIGAQDIAKQLLASNAFGGQREAA